MQHEHGTDRHERPAEPSWGLECPSLAGRGNREQIRNRVGALARPLQLFGNELATLCVEAIRLDQSELDAEESLRENLGGLQKLLRELGDEAALRTY